MLADIVGKNFHLDVGIVGTRYLLEVGCNRFQNKLIEGAFLTWQHQRCACNRGADRLPELGLHDRTSSEFACGCGEGGERAAAVHHELILGSDHIVGELANFAISRIWQSQPHYGRPFSRILSLQLVWLISALCCFGYFHVKHFLFT